MVGPDTFFILCITEKNRREDEYGDRLKTGRDSSGGRAKGQGTVAIFGGIPVFGGRMAADGLKLVESVQCARVLADAVWLYLGHGGNLRILLPARRDPGFQKRRLHGRSCGCRQKSGEGAGHSRRQDLHRSLAESLLAEGKADLIGLARVLWQIPSGHQKSKREGKAKSFTAHRSAMTPAQACHKREGRLLCALASREASGVESQIECTFCF